MNTPLPAATAAGEDRSWTRVSSFKPQLAGALLAAAGALIFAALAGHRAGAVPLAIGGIAAALGVILVNGKVVHRRGRDYRVSTLFYSEVVTVDDVCLTVTRPGRLWTCFRIHLRRPARFGWRVSFVPADTAAVRPRPAADF